MMFPQVPVGGYFVDFGDPIRKIALEADGRDWHDRDKDTARDGDLWANHGWRVYRVKGYQTMPRSRPETPWEDPDFCRMDADDRRALIKLWANKDCEALVWAIAVVYHGASRVNAGAAREVLDAHCYVNYPDWLFGGEQ